MPASTKLSTSIKALCYLAQNPEHTRTSADIAQAIAVNASKIRSLLSMMAHQGIVHTVQGKDGGFQLNKKTTDIHLQDIYCAIEDRRAFYLDVQNGAYNQNVFTQNINQFFDELFFDIQVDIEDKMKKISLESIINKTSS